MDIRDLKRVLTWEVDKNGGEYKEYPVRIAYYYKGRRAYEDDYPFEIDDEQKLYEFQQAMVEGLADVRLGE